MRPLLLTALVLMAIPLLAVMVFSVNTMMGIEEMISSAVDAPAAGTPHHHQNLSSRFLPRVEDLQHIGPRGGGE